MRAGNYNSEIHDVAKIPTAKRPTYRKEKVVKAKFNRSVENKIENCWYSAIELGWSYSDFATHCLDVLVIIQLRDKAKRRAACD